MWRTEGTTDLPWEDYAMSDGVTFSSIPLFKTNTYNRLANKAKSMTSHIRIIYRITIFVHDVTAVAVYMANGILENVATHTLLSSAHIYGDLRPFKVEVQKFKYLVQNFEIVLGLLFYFSSFKCQ